MAHPSHRRFGERVYEVSGPRIYDDALSNEGIRSKWAMLADSVLDAEGKAQAEEIVVSVEAWMTLASS